MIDEVRPDPALAALEIADGRETQRAQGILARIRDDGVAQSAGAVFGGLLEMGKQVNGAVLAVTKLGADDVPATPRELRDAEQQLAAARQLVESETKSLRQVPEALVADALKSAALPRFRGAEAELRSELLMYLQRAEDPKRAMIAIAGDADNEEWRAAAAGRPGRLVLAALLGPERAATAHEEVRQAALAFERNSGTSPTRQAAAKALVGLNSEGALVPTLQGLVDTHRRRAEILLGRAEAKLAEARRGLGMPASDLANRLRVAEAELERRRAAERR